MFFVMDGRAAFAVFLFLPACLHCRPVYIVVILCCVLLANKIHQSVSC